MELIFLNSICINMATEKVARLYAPYEITKKNKNGITVVGCVHNGNDLVKNVSIGQLNKPFIRKDKLMLYADMWILGKDVGEESHDRLSKFFLDGMKRMHFELSEHDIRFISHPYDGNKYATKI